MAPRPKSPKDDDHDVPPDAHGSSREQAAALLATGASLTAVARRCGVPRRTLYDWRQDAAFGDLVQRAARNITRELVGVAVARLRRILEKGDDAHAVKVCDMLFRLAGWFDEGRYQPPAPIIPGQGSVDQPSPVSPATPEPQPVSEPRSPKESREAYRDLLGG